MTLPFAYGLAAQALLIGWVASKLAARLPPRHQLGLAGAVAALALIPLADGVSAAMALRALWGDPSVTTAQLLALSLAGRPAKVGRLPAAALAAYGIGFYVLAMGDWGLGDFDPYRLGYPGWPALAVAAALGAAALLAWRRGRPIYLWLLALDLAAHAGGLHESPNLWDVLFDPLLVAAAAVVAIRGARR